jgi:hypothetical protein
LCSDDASEHEIAKTGATGTSSAWFATRLVQDRVWDDKKEEAVWRGTCNGFQHMGTTGWSNHIRFKIAEVGARNKSMFDTGLLPFSRCKTLVSTPNLSKLLKKQGKVQFLPFSDLLTYKLSIDGNGDGHCSQRFSKLMLSETVILRHPELGTSFLLNLARPWKHYVPIKFDASDLHSHVHYLRYNRPDIAKRIAKEGKELAEKVLSPQGITCYMKELLRLYANMMTYTPVLSPEDVMLEHNSPDIALSTMNLRGYPDRMNETNLIRTRCKVFHGCMPDKPDGESTFFR